MGLWLADKHLELCVSRSVSRQSKDGRGAAYARVADHLVHCLIIYTLTSRVADQTCDDFLNDEIL